MLKEYNWAYDPWEGLPYDTHTTLDRYGAGH